MGAVEGLRLLLLLLLGGVAPLPGAASWHTLHYFGMALWEHGNQIPQFTSLAYVDNHLIGRCDRGTGQYVPQSSWVEEISLNDSDFWARSTRWDLASNLVTDLMILKNLFNQSNGIHTLQKLSGCELSGDGHTARFVKYGYDGRDFLSLDQATLTWTAMSAEAKSIKRRWDAEQDRGEFWEHSLTPCVEWLHTHLRYGKETLLRNDPPTAHVTRKAGSDGLETLVCRLHGFYPREIDVTWWKGGEDQKSDTLTGGVLPNSDGTYHTWFSIEVDPEERDRYRCRVEHDGLPEPLDLAWEEPAPESKVSLIEVSVLEVTAVLALLGAVVILLSTSVSKVGLIVVLVLYFVALLAQVRAMVILLSASVPKVENLVFLALQVAVVFTLVGATVILLSKKPEEGRCQGAPTSMSTVKLIMLSVLLGMAALILLGAGLSLLFS